MSPFIVTTKRQWHELEFETERVRTSVVSRVAVGTLQEAREATEAAARTSRIAIDALVAESGGSVGPLPDGTLIQVEHVGWRHIEDSLGYHLGYPDGPEAALAAFNARQAS